MQKQDISFLQSENVATPPPIWSPILIGLAFLARNISSIEKSRPGTCHRAKNQLTLYDMTRLIKSRKRVHGCKIRGMISSELTFFIMNKASLVNNSV